MNYPAALENTNSRYRYFETGSFFTQPLYENTEDILIGAYLFLLQHNHFLHSVKAARLQAIEVDAAGNMLAIPVGAIPFNIPISCFPRTVEQRRNQFSQHVIHIKPYRCALR